MLKKRYKLFLGVFLLLVAVGTYLSRSFPYSYDTPAVESYSPEVEVTEKTALPDIPMFFSFEGNTVVLQCEPEVYENMGDISFRYAYGEADAVSLAEFSFEDTMNGTVLAQSQNAEGSVLVSAKASPRITQGFDAYAWDNHVFGDETIPVEICYSGSSAMSTEISVLVYGQPYSGRLHLQSVSGKDAAMEIRDGVVEGLSIYDLREGLAVTVVDEETGAHLVGTYVAEDYPMFSPGYVAALGNLFLLIVLTGVGCGAVCLIRMVWKNHKEQSTAKALGE